MNLGVISDADCNLQKHLSNISKTAFNQLRDGSKVRRLLPRRTLKRWFTHLFQQIIVMNCLLDYNYVLYAGLVVQIVNSSQARLLNHVQHGSLISV